MLHVVQKIHIATRHGGRDKMIKEANKKYSVKYLELQKEEKYPKSALLHQSVFLISMATEQQILSYDLGKP
jgi:hypothetical protein